MKRYFKQETNGFGNRTQTVINGVTNTYALGLGNRLSHCSSGAQPPETTLAYAYDLAGNRTQTVINGVTKRTMGTSRS